MEDERPDGTEGTEPPTSADPVPPLADELRPHEDEVRRMVEAGAASPEELRALAAKLEAKRRHEESLWKRDVKPALKQSKKLRHRSPKPEATATDDDATPPASHGLFLAAVLLVGVLVLIAVAAQTSFLWLALPVVAVLGYAWVQGRRGNGRD